MADDKGITASDAPVAPEEVGTVDAPVVGDKSKLANLERRVVELEKASALFAEKFRMALLEHSGRPEV